MVGAGELAPMLSAQSEPMILNRVKEAEKRIKALDVPSPLRGLIEPGADVAARWAAAPLSTQREVLRALLCPEHFGEVRVMPSPRRGGARVPVVERVAFHRAASAAAWTN